MENSETFKLTTSSVKAKPIAVDAEDVEMVKKLYGRNVKPPIEICSRNLSRPMYPLMLYLCYFCQKSSSERDCFISDAGRVFFSVQLCPKCIEFNKVMQDAGQTVLKRHLAEREMMAHET